jgi:hypothetical protein
MRWQPLGIYLPEEKLVSGTTLDYAFEVFKYINAHQIPAAGQAALNSFRHKMIQSY